MKNIIKKNIKLLLRSKTSTLLLIFGPLIIILLVGISFSTNTFNLKIGVFSEQYSDLTRSYIFELSNSSFDVREYKTEIACKGAVKEQKIQACIVFPTNMQVTDDNSNVIKFHVDQSKINLVYFVMSSLSTSFGEVSNEVSKELTSRIVTTLFSTKQGLEIADASVKDIISQNAVVVTNSDTAAKTLGGIDLKADSGTVDLSLSSINDDLDTLLEDTTKYTQDGLSMIEKIKDEGSLSANQTSHLNDIKSDLNTLKTSISVKQSAAKSSLAELTRNVEQSLGRLSAKLKNADSANKEVIAQLSQLKANADLLATKAGQLSDKLNKMHSDITSIEIINPENIVSPITTEIIPIAESGTNLGFLFPSLIVIFIMFLGLLLPSSQIISEKNSKAFFRVFTAPKKPIYFVLATYFTSLILISLQVLIILTVSQFYFNINFFDNISLLLLSLFLIMSLFILMGMFIGYSINSEEISMLASVSIATLLLLTSGIILPIETMPSYIADKIKFNPVVSSSDAFRNSILFGSNFSLIWESLGFLTILIVVILLMIFLSSRLSDFHINKPSGKKYEDRLIASNFTFANRNAKTLPEFMISLQTLSDERFSELLEENAYHKWLLRIYKNEGLASKIDGVKEKRRILEILLDEAKRMQQK
ncbi:MAG: ABC transporter permease [archaeon]